MTQRTDRVALPGGAMDDFTRHWSPFGRVACTHFMPVERLTAPAAEPRVHPPVRGLS